MLDRLFNPLDDLIMRTTSHTDPSDPSGTYCEQLAEKFTACASCVDVVGERVASCVPSVYSDGGVALVPDIPKVVTDTVRADYGIFVLVDHVWLLSMGAGLLALV